MASLMKFVLLSAVFCALSARGVIASPTWIECQVGCTIGCKPEPRWVIIYMFDGTGLNWYDQKHRQLWRQPDRKITTDRFSYGDPSEPNYEFIDRKTSDYRSR